MSNNMKPIMSNVGAWGAAAITWSHVDTVTKLIATCFAILVSILTARYVYEGIRLRRLQVKRELCHQCKEGHVPLECPYNDRERPEGCPHKELP